MTKRIFIAFAIAAALVSCTKEPTNNESVSPEGGKLIVKASAPTTKLTFTDNGAGGYSLTFQDETDHLWGYFKNGATQLKYINTSDEEKDRMFMSLDESTLSLDHKSASFKSDCKTIPADATDIFFYLDNNVTPISYNSTPTFCDLRNQSGQLADANLLHVIVGGTEVSSMTTDPGTGDKIAHISFAYKTSVLKVELTFPDGVTPTADEHTTITLYDEDVYNKVHISWGNPGGSSTKGAITFHPASVSGQVATAYITVWENSVFDGATITGDVDGVKCSVVFNAASSISAGKVYRVARTLAFDSIDKWTTDAAGSVTFNSGESYSSIPSWLSYNSTTGVISWTANDTNLPRIETLTFDSGKTVKITQISAADFKGTWTINSKKFGPSVANDNTDVTFTNPYNVSAPDGLTNNIGISGLYDNYILDAIVDIDYTAKMCKFGIMFDGTSAQELTAPVSGKSHMTALPGLGGGFVSKGIGWDFAPNPVCDANNYFRLWISCSADFNKLTYNSSNAKTLKKSSKTYYVVAISLVTASDASATGLNSTYTRVYQANPGDSAATGMTFTRK